jgi:hypothetical protein
MPQEAPVCGGILGRERGQRTTAFDDGPQDQALGLLAVGALRGDGFVQGKPCLYRFVVVVCVERAGLPSHKLNL